MGLSPVLYNAGLDGDLVVVLDALARLVPQLAVVGFSLGASLALLAAGRNAARLPPGLLGIVGVSPPLDLGVCTDALGRHRLYQAYFMGSLRRAYRELHAARPDLYERGREAGMRTVREYDERITAYYGGYRDAALIVAAADDPMIPLASVERWGLSPRVTREILPTGGHVGFVAPTEAPGAFWAAERALAFLDALR
jgi:hypothetical protein